MTTTGGGNDEVGSVFAEVDAMAASAAPTPRSTVWFAANTMTMKTSMLGCTEADSSQGSASSPTPRKA